MTVRTAPPRSPRPRRSHRHLPRLRSASRRGHRQRLDRQGTPERASAVPLPGGLRNAQGPAHRPIRTDHERTGHRDRCRAACRPEQPHARHAGTRAMTSKIKLEEDARIVKDCDNGEVFFRASDGVALAAYNGCGSHRIEVTPRFVQEYCDTDALSDEQREELAEAEEVRNDLD